MLFSGRLHVRGAWLDLDVPGPAGGVHHQARERPVLERPGDRGVPRGAELEIHVPTARPGPEQDRTAILET